MLVGTSLSRCLGLLLVSSSVMRRVRCLRLLVLVGGGSVRLRGLLQLLLVVGRMIVFATRLRFPRVCWLGGRVLGLVGEMSRRIRR